MFASSMGLRFQVPLDLESFNVHASWGVCELVKGEGDGPDGRSRDYQRTPVDIPVKVWTQDLVPGQTKPYPLKDDVLLRIDRYDDVVPGAAIIEVALCNDRETPRQIPVNAWLYQTKLRVSAGDDAVFLPVRDVREDTRDEDDAELRRLNLQYRDRLEFAIGRTCSVDWKVEPGSRRASAVWTTWLPTVETPQTTAEEISDALLDMTVLAEASVDELRAGLTPIVDGYAEWLEGEKKPLTGCPSICAPRRMTPPPRPEWFNSSSPGSRASPV